MGLETEYGLFVEGQGAADQLECSRQLVAGAPFGRPGLWDDRFESPRADIRGFSVDRLQVDPDDAEFDRDRRPPPTNELRADRVLDNGARFYNDHGHPEYATPECTSLRTLVEADIEGQRLVHLAARDYARQLGRDVRIYKNNTDFHGASYGTHESYLVPRSIGFERLMRAVTPVLVARQVLCGAGKVGAEHGRGCTYQISQRADFFSEWASVDTLYRRPVFNTRDEPHADPERWVRLHVIAGDANMIPSATFRKVGLVRLALALEELGEAPCWALANPVTAFEDVSKDERMRFEIALEGRSWTNAYEILESLFAASSAIGLLDTDPEMRALVDHCRPILDAVRSQPERAAPHVDWLAKRALLEQVMDETGLDWRSPELRSYDLEFHNIDTHESLFDALVEMGSCEPAIPPTPGDHRASRATARGLATRYRELVRAGWRTLTFAIDGKVDTIELEPDRDYAHLQPTEDVVTFIESLCSSTPTTD